MSFLTSGKTLDKGSDKVSDKIRIPGQLRGSLSRPSQPRSGQASLSLPSVNLLPTSTLQALDVRRIRQRFVAAGLVGAVLVGGGWVLETQQLHSAQNRLAAEQALTPALNAQVAALAPIAQFYDLLQARKQTASAAMAAEVLFSGALADLAGRTPAGIDITAMSVTLTAATVAAVAPPVSPLDQAGIDANGNDVTTSQNPATAGTAGTGAARGGAAGASTGTAGPTPGAVVAQPVTCARPDPFNPAPIIGCVTLTGTAQSRAQVGALVQSLRSADLYADPFVATTTISAADGSEVVAFQGSVGLTGAAVSGRYADLSWLADPKVLAEAERMIADGNTASHRLALRAKQAAAAAKAKADAEAAAKAQAERKAQRQAEKQLSAQLQAAAAAAAAAAQQQAAAAAAAAQQEQTQTVNGGQ
ncbi:MAG TPA: hypothetical protein VMZ00_01755 [Sporichthya sp.]|nr:hypothetical protein [Sporichthya sp.]